MCTCPNLCCVSRNLYIAKFQLVTHIIYRNQCSLVCVVLAHETSMMRIDFDDNKSVVIWTVPSMAPLSSFSRLHEHDIHTPVVNRWV